MREEKLDWLQSKTFLVTLQPTFKIDGNKTMKIPSGSLMRTVRFLVPRSPSVLSSQKTVQRTSTF